MNAKTVATVFAYLALAGQLVTTILAAVTSFISGQPVVAPQIRTYVSGKHVAIDITVTPIP